MKLRPKTQTFLGKTTIKSYYCIEHQSGTRSWRLLGDENGVFKFATAAERDAKIEELMATHAPNSVFNEQAGDKS